MVNLILSLILQVENTFSIFKGALLWINDLNWSKLAAWKKKDKKILKVGEKVLGTYKVYDNL